MNGQVARHHVVREYEQDQDRVMIHVIGLLNIFQNMQQKPKKVAILKNAVITIGNLGNLLNGAHAIVLAKARIDDNDRDLVIYKLRARTKG